MLASLFHQGRRNIFIRPFVAKNTTPQGRLLKLAQMAASASGHEGPNWKRYLFLLLALALVYAAVDEAILRKRAADAKRSGRAVGTITAIAPTPGYPDRFDVTVTYTASNRQKRSMVGRSMPMPTPPLRAGKQWPDPVHYDLADGDATLRDYPVQWNDVAYSVIMAAIILGYAYYPHH